MELICNLNHLGGATLVNLEDNMVARRINLLKCMCMAITTSWCHVVNGT